MSASVSGLFQTVLPQPPSKQALYSCVSCDPSSRVSLHSVHVPVDPGAIWFLYSNLSFKFSLTFNSGIVLSGSAIGFLCSGSFVSAGPTCLGLLVNAKEY